MEQTKIQRWGNSLAVRLPRTITRSLNLTEGSTVFIAREKKSVSIKPKQSMATTARLWRKFLIPSGRKKRENVSDNIDNILYGAPRR